MLRELQIRRLAVIEDLRVQFAEGLNILTGETGAGKSILVTAIGLALGWRASNELIRTGCEDAEVIAVFSGEEENVQSVRRELGLPSAGELRVRRVVQSAGRNKVEINDVAVPLAALRRLGEALLNLYGQHEAQGLMRPETHLFYLDEYGALGADRTAIAGQAARFRELDRRLAELLRRDAEREARLGYLRFLIEEIAAAKIVPGEDEDLAARIKVQSHAETLIRLGQRIGEELYDREEGAVAERAGELRRAVENNLELDAGLRSIYEGLQELTVLAEDLAAQGRAYAESLEFDPRRLEAMEERLQTLRNLKKKYGGSLAAVLKTTADAAAEMDGLERLSTEIADLSRERQQVIDELLGAVERLSKARRRAAKKMRGEVEKELGDLDMAGTSFQVEVEDLETGGLVLGERRLDETGADRVEFLISPNVGELPRPLARIASGGELSRVMLAIKRVLARHFPVPTLIFDEIDAGVGGAQAERLGRKLREAAGPHQVLCITHLPQIAALADHHYLVRKQVSGGRTKTDVATLAKNERIEELARMLGGETITPVTRRAAKELLDRA